uniref:ribosomal protein S3 n=1 Tax=Exserohilum rostratum TaxID=1659837 RepID=UPI002008EC60|nr:ribosomal protein S3 [Exserohilum rostratum]UOU81290.1 ribosomal protein S3 [Exserohilum rostratum]
MLNIFKNKQNNFNDKSLNTNYIIEKNNKIQSNSERDEYNNIIFHSSSSKEWLSSVYSYNKSYLKSLISKDAVLNTLLRSYCNMLQDKIKILFKRRRDNKVRYSANKIYASRAELKHTNTKLFITLYLYNKQKSSIEWFILKILVLVKYRKLILYRDKIFLDGGLIAKGSKIFSEYLTPKRLEDFRLFLAEKQKVGGKKIFLEDRSEKFSIHTRLESIRWFHKSKVKTGFVPNHKNRIPSLLKNNFFIFRKWNMAFFKTNNNLIRYFLVNLRRKYLKLSNIPSYNIRLLKKLVRLQKILFNSLKLLNFNKSKFNSLNLNLRNFGLISLIEKLYNKKVEINLVELKSIHLNSDVFSSAVALKLRDRKNKAVRVLRKAILQMVRVPDLHTLITFDDNIEAMNKNNIINTIKQQVVSGVRFEASGRLTRRLTAMRAVFKYRYAGSLKNIRSSFNNKSSTMLRGYAKSNVQYTLINSKTRNGTFGLKGWVSSH